VRAPRRPSCRGNGRVRQVLERLLERDCKATEPFLHPIGSDIQVSAAGPLRRVTMDPLEIRIGGFQSRLKAAPLFDQLLGPEETLSEGTTKQYGRVSSP
jgi:hypothetical protein